MNHTTDPVLTAPAHPTPPRHRRRPLSAVLTLTALLTGLLVLAPLAPAAADNLSGYCYDEYPQPTVHVLRGEGGLWLAFENGLQNGEPGFVNVCYGTDQPGNPKVVGGMFGVAVLDGSGNPVIYAHNVSDENSVVKAPAEAYSWPSITLSPGGTNGGQVAIFRAPVHVCFGPFCYPPSPADGLADTGLVVGTLTQRQTSGVGTAYGVSSLCLYADGIQVSPMCNQPVGDSGATATGALPLDYGVGQSQPGPCSFSICVPSVDYVETTDSRVATVYLAGIEIPVGGVHTCPYQKNSPDPHCP